MEETKKSNLNLIAKFKALKKPYQIAFFAGIVAIVLLLVFNSFSPSTPFDKIMKADSVEEALHAYGLEGVNPGYDYYLECEYPWLGYNGTLKIQIHSISIYGFGIDDSVRSAYWELETKETEKVANKIIRIMDKKCGKGETAQGLHVWYDMYGNKYTLYLSPSQISLYFK